MRFASLVCYFPEMNCFKRSICHEPQQALILSSKTVGVERKRMALRAQHGEGAGEALAVSYKSTLK